MPERGNGAADDGLGQRLRRYQGRFGPVVTRVLLIGIFGTGLTAQFVKPVGDALEGKAYLGGALLSLVGYVLYDAVRELSSSVRVPSRALVNSSQLGGFVSEAFQARRVEISFLGYTGETLYNELYHRLEGLFDNPGPTRKVSVRMLVPDFGQPMTVPSKVGEDARPVDDPAFRLRMIRRCHCIFNRAQVLHGLYDVSARMRLHERGPEFYDPKGYRTDLNVWSREGTAAAEAAVSTWIKHFDDLWSLAKRPDWPQRAAA
ncbi:hypothetical protein ACQEV2_19600 [Streptomyces sp. CA-251387]|uniref:hypothetical protein n=1 Tax=Streptomyces sp. CA-251387 TaxID=3240064 RepID=UPI003D932570